MPNSRPDPPGNLTQRKYPDGTRVTFAYDASGNRILKADSTGRITSAYDKLDRREQELLRGSATITYRYDAVGRQKLRAYETASAAERTTYAYDVAGQLTSLRMQDNSRVSFTYDELGRRTTKRLPGDVRTSFSYDDANRITGVWHLKSPSTVLASLVYTNDPVGNRTHLVDNGNVVTYTHDAIDQLKTERRTGANAYGTTHVYDPAGNRTRLDRSTVNPGGWTFTYDAANELTQRQNGGTQNYSFDADGNMLSSPFTIAQLANAWDYENRLRMTRLPTTPPLTLTYGYDADNRLRHKTQNFFTVATETFDWDANWNLAGTSGGSIYIPEPGLYGPLVAKRESGTLYFPLFDAIGSAILVVDASGAVQSTRRYSAYGTALDTVAGPLGDVGWLGEHGYLTGLSLAYIYVRNRWYHPELARWLSKDPAVDDRLNLYRYVRNRPLFLLDLSGMRCCLPSERPICCPPKVDLGVVIVPADASLEEWKQVISEWGDWPPASPPPPNCGPDVTSWFDDQLKKVLEASKNFGLVSPQLRRMFAELKFENAGLRTDKCPTEHVCKDTVMLCGTCIDVTELGNIAFGFGAGGTPPPNRFLNSISIMLYGGFFAEVKTGRGFSNANEVASALAGAELNFMNETEKRGGLCSILNKPLQFSDYYVVVVQSGINDINELGIIRREGNILHQYQEEDKQHRHPQEIVLQAYVNLARSSALEMNKRSECKTCPETGSFVKQLAIGQDGTVKWE